MDAKDMDEVPFFQVDAFAEEPFRGNPAAVCLMPCDLDDSLYRSIAQEMNLSETAFVEKQDDGGYRLRWFTPKREVPLCGHATLATAHVLFDHLGFEDKRISFYTLSGALYAERVEEGIRLTFPRNDPVEVEPPIPLLEALGLTSWRETLFSEAANSKLLVHVETQAQVSELRPDFAALRMVDNRLDVKGIIVTTRGSDPHDFVSRYFAPWMGVDEDPVTGSAHTVLAPYWGRELEKRRMRAYQASRRGGELLLELIDDRVNITGKAITVIEGVLRLLGR